MQWRLHLIAEAAMQASLRQPQLYRRAMAIITSAHALRRASWLMVHRSNNLYRKGGGGL
jgi:hypothetical protein